MVLKHLAFIHFKPFVSIVSVDFFMIVPFTLSTCDEKWLIRNVQPVYTFTAAKVYYDSSCKTMYTVAHVKCGFVCIGI